MNKFINKSQLKELIKKLPDDYANYLRRLITINLSQCMSKVYITYLAISLILGNARAQVSQVDMRIGSFNNLQRQDLPRNDDNLRSLDLESYKDVASLENAISPENIF